MSQKMSHNSANYLEDGTRDRIRTREGCRAARRDGFDGVQQGLSVREKMDPMHDDQYLDFLTRPFGSAYIP